METHREHSRSFALTLGSKSYVTPAFFPAVSSCCTRFPVLDCVRVLASVSHPRFLVSAYDFANTRTERERMELQALLRRRIKGGSVVMLDSGNFEALCRGDRRWKLAMLQKVIASVPADICFSFDVFPQGKEPAATYVQRTITSIARTAGSQITGATIPIVHAEPKSLPAMISKVVKGVNPQVIAVAERELGSDLLERVTVIKRIRVALDVTGADIPLHILGTSDPVSILSYSVAGADSFDGLEWARSFAEPKSARFLDFSQGALVKCDCHGCSNEKLRYELRVLLHNLIFYEAYMDMVRSSILDGAEHGLLERLVGSDPANKISNALGAE